MHQNRWLAAIAELEDDGGLDEISFEEWFGQFEEQGHAFLYSPKTRFNKLVRRNPPDPA